ncbi:MAG TPA: VTT domain-containing protein [Vicinamibacterales bacterium]|nr:VTT domain-containing protein [Vicinamibacterales bacterium]
MHLPDAGGPLAYLVILIAASLEGEIVFVTAATLVSQGRLDAVGVVISGAIGAAVGDQFYFYALRGRLRRWLDRFPSIARRGHTLVRRVRAAETATVLLLRFSPGLRIALAAACAYAEVPPLKFSILDSISSVVWAAGLLVLVAYAGPKWLPGVGISGWWSALIPAVIIVVIARFLGRAEKHAVDIKNS